MAGLYAPLPTLRSHPRGGLRTDRGRRGLLLLHRSGLSPHTPCRSPGALTRVAACTLARSPNRDRYPKASDISSPPCLLRLLPAGAVAGWGLHPLESAAFSRRTWKEERRGVFLDYNQNAKDRTVASAWSVRPTPDARVSMPLEWDEVADCDPAAFTLATAPARFAERGDASAGIDSAVGSLDALLDLSASQEAAGLGDAPWPPHYKKQRDEPPRVAPSRRKALGPSTERRGHRESTQPLITVAKAARKADALAGLERWKARYPEAAARLHGDDVLVELDARSINHLDSHPDQSAQRSRGRAPARRSARA